MNGKTQTYLLAFVALMTVVNTVLILNGSGATEKAIEPTHENTALVQSNNLQPDASHDHLDHATPEPVKPAGPPTAIAFAQTEHDFGKIKQNTENKHIFKFTNTGSNPLIIQDAKGSCGCTVPKYPKEPIAPGEQGEIEVVYSPGTQKGLQTKTVTLTANTEPNQTTLQIKAEVEEGA